jgi:hypothetical protein
MSCTCGCENKAAALLKSELTVVNFGMESFYNDLKSQSVSVAQVDWKPPVAGGDLLSKLKKLRNH